MRALLDPKLIRGEDEASVFNHPLTRIGAGNAASESELRAVLPELGDLELRITESDPGWIIVWVNKEKYNEFRKTEKAAEDKESLKKFFKLLPILSLVYLVGSAVLATLVAIRISIAGLLFAGIGAVSFPVAWLVMFAICIVICAGCTLYFIARKGKVD